MIEKIGITSICSKKLAQLESNGMEIVGLILVHRDASGKIERATVDNFGRVQWWDLDDSGRMVAKAGSYGNDC